MPLKQKLSTQKQKKKDKHRNKTQKQNIRALVASCQACKQPTKQTKNKL